MALSRLLDVSPDAMIDAGIDLFDKMDLDILQKKQSNQFSRISPVIH